MQKTFAMGSYSGLTLQDAHAICKGAQAQMVSGIDPTTERRVEKPRTVASGKSYEQIATEWRATKYPADSKTGDWHGTRVTMNLFPDFGSLPGASIDRQMALQTLRRIEARYSLDMTNRVQRLVVRKFNKAIACALHLDNPGAPLSEALTGHNAGHFAPWSRDLPQRC